MVVHLTDAEMRAVKRAAGDCSVSDYLRGLVRAALKLGKED